MHPLTYAAPLILSALVAMAALMHFDLRARGVPVRHFLDCPAAWRAVALERAALRIVNLDVVSP